ncbi:MAG: hypothetical protein WCV73_01000 [Patescibacteria group bacterium]|jgi:hypothetical protein
MKTIKKFNILSVAKVAGILNGGLYFVIGLVVNFGVLVIGIPALNSVDLLGFGSGILAVLLLSLLIGAVSSLIGAMMAWLYNISANLVGGIMWEEEEVKKPFPAFDLPAKHSPEHLATNPQPQNEANNIIDHFDQ